MIKQGRNLFALLGLLFVPQVLRAQAANPTPPQTSGPDVRVEFFGPERGYNVGGQDVTLLCVVRNVGDAALPADTLRLRCFAMNGLEYTTGDTRPALPALARQQAVAYRWRLSPASTQGAMVAAVLIDRILPMGAPAADGTSSQLPITPRTLADKTTLSVIPRFTSMPKSASVTIPAGGAPKAAGNADDAFIANDRVQVRVLSGERRFPLLTLAAREGAGWKSVANAVPLLELNAAEEGQLPWWEMFRWRETRTRGDKESATLTLIGTLGTRWRAEIVLEVRANTAAVEGRMRLTPLRTLRLYGARLPRLLPVTEDAAAQKADGSPLALLANEPILPENTRIGAARSGGVTYGLTWTSVPPLPDWNWMRLPVSDTNLMAVQGVEWDGPDTGTVVLPQATIEIPFRLFALGASETLRDALRFLAP